MVVIIFGGKVAIYNKIICLSYIHYRNYQKTIQLNEYVLIFFGIFVISNDDCWVICMLLSNVKSLFDHVIIKYTYSKVTTTQFIEHSTTERVAMPFKHKSGSRKRQEKKEQDEKAAKLPK